MKFVINGCKKLNGTIKVSGAKNAALKMIAASIITKNKVTLHNVPRITDVETMAEALKFLGGDVSWNGNTLNIDTTNIKKYDLPQNLTCKIRGSVVFVGPLLARFEKAVLPWPGGCQIGDRPLTTHTDAFEQVGVKVDTKDKSYHFSIADDAKTDITLLERSVTATENVVMFCAGRVGEFTVRNAAAEPEIDDLIAFLNAAGASVNRTSPSEIHICGENNFQQCEYTVMGDRIEAGTLMVAGLLCADTLKIEGFNPEFISAPIELCRNHGADIEVSDNSIVIKKSKMKAMHIMTQVYPGFPTDLQSPFGLLFTQCVGESRINETLFSDRLRYLYELKAMGADIEIINEHEAKIVGPSVLEGHKIESTDLRAGATMVLAGLVANGETVVDKAEIIDRGYENIDDKLLHVGADIKRIK